MEIPRVGVPDALASRLSMAEQHEYLSRRSMLKGAAAGGDGTVYATCGGGGRSLYSFPVPDTFAGEFQSYHWVKGGEKVSETVAWSRVRYTGYSFLAIDVEPAWAGRKTTLTVRTLRNDGAEIDRFALRRTAGARRHGSAALTLGADPGDA